MNRRIISVWLSLAMVLGFVVIVDVTIDFTPHVEGITLYVNTTGTGGAYPKIQYAIDNASDSYSVFVYSGTYYENVIVNKTINLTGEDKDATIIDSGGSGDVVHVTANGTNINGFTVTGSGTSAGDAGVELDNVQNCRIYDIKALSNHNGIYLSYSNGNKIYNNTVPSNNNYYGIHLKFSTGNNITGNSVNTVRYFAIFLSDSNDNNITDNTVSDNYEDGMFIDRSNGNFIFNNDVLNNRDGIYLQDSNDCDIINNTVSLNELYGIYIYNSDGHNLTGNTVTNNERGFNIRGSSNNNINDNDASDNDVGIELRESSENNNVTNNTANSNVHDGISILYSDGNIITDNTISDNMGGLYIHQSNRSTISNNTASYNRDDGISLIESSGNLLSNNTLIENGVYVSGSVKESWNMHYIDTSNTVNGKPVYYCKNLTGGVVPSDAGEVILANCTNVRVENQVLINCGVSILIGFSSHNDITNNTISSNQYMGIYIAYSSQNNFTGNFLTNNHYSYYVYKSHKNLISDNTFSSNSYHCIFLWYSDENDVVDNLFTPNNRVSVYIWHGDDNDLIDNIIYSNIIGGIYLEYADGNLIKGNYISSNGGDGIDLDESWYNDILENTISSNDNFGINLYHSRWNNIIKNNVQNNDEGISMYAQAYDNKIYHNNIIDNTEQGKDVTDNRNQWDNGYPSGGNYWSDYGGVDIKKGPSQNIAGSDGIGDTSYMIDTNSQDRYPLMKPIENYTILNQGWNLISLPLIQENQNLIKVLEMIDGYYDTVEWYNISDTNDPWKVYNVYKLFGIDLTKINETMGFWIHVIPPGGAVLLHNGTHPLQNQTINLYPGWNLVGYPSKTSYNRTDGLNNLTFGTHVDSIWTFDAAIQKWEELRESDYFKSGRGYWVNAKVECKWEVPL